MSKTTKLAVLGSGFIAYTDYYPAFVREDIRDLVEVTAICDPVPGRAAEHIEKFGFSAKAYTDYDAMLAEADMDLLIVLSPIPLHYQQVKKALLAGKNVYCQKTFTETAAEATELVALAKEKGLILCAAPGQMVLAENQEVKKLMEQGVLGKVCWARGFGGHPGHEKQELFGIDPSWYYKKGGGPMGDVAVYSITTLVNLLGPAKRVCGFSGIAEPDRFWNGRKLDVQMDDNTYLLIDFGESRFAAITGNFCTPQFRCGPLVEMFGTKGIARIGGWSKREVPFEYYTSQPVNGSTYGWYQPAEDIAAPSKPETVHTVQDVLHICACMETGERPLNTADRAAHVIEIIEKGYEAAETGRTMELTTTFDF